MMNIFNENWKWKKSAFIRIGLKFSHIVDICITNKQTEIISKRYSLIHINHEFDVSVYTFFRRKFCIEFDFPFSFFSFLVMVRVPVWMRHKLKSNSKLNVELDESHDFAVYDYYFKQCHRLTPVAERCGLTMIKQMINIFGICFGHSFIRFSVKITNWFHYI